MGTEIIIQPTNAVEQRREEPGDIMAIIARASTTQGLSVEVMNGLMGIRREMMAEKAKREFDDAMAGFQRECPPVVKTRDVQGAYKYAPFEEVVQAMKECESKHGFHHTINTEDTEPGWIIALCEVTHSGGHSKTSRVKLPLGTQTKMMSNTQVYASAQSYASRRAFCNAFGIVPQGEDLDGRVKQKPPGPRNAPVATPTPSEPPKPATAPAKRTRDQLLSHIRIAGYPAHRWQDGMGQRSWEVAKPIFAQWLVDELDIQTPLEKQDDAELERTLVAIQNKLAKPLI